MIFNKVNKLYSYHPNSDLEHFHHPNKIVQAHLEFISKPTPGNYIWGRGGNPPTVDSPTVYISYLWRHTAYGLCVCLLSLGMFLRFFLYFYVSILHFFLLPNSIPLCG